jgi:lysophospholipase L1-like esterase
VLILGDSYSAGNGTGTNYKGPADCYRSDDTWGQQAAAQLAANLGRTIQVTNRACSGGVTGDFFRARDMGTFEAGVTNWRFHTSESDAIQRAKEWCAAKRSSNSLNADEFYTTGTPATSNKGAGLYAPRCTRWLKPQLDSVNDSYDIVLFTIGGNDAGFARIGQFCLAQTLGPFTRNTDKCKSALSGAEQAVSRTDSRGLRSRSSAVLSGIQAKLNPVGRATPGKVALLTYPYLIGNNDYSFDNVKVGTRLLDLSNRGEAVQRDQVSVVNRSTNVGGCIQPTVILADGTKAAFRGHEQSATIGFSSPDSVWLWHLKLPTTDALHPKPAGHAAQANVAVTALTRAGFGQPCAAADSFVLNRGDNGSEGPNLQTTLEGLGDVVQRSSVIPAGGLSGFDTVWVVMAYQGLTVAEQTALSDYVRGGGRLYLTGERPCCEALNQSIEPVINGLVRGGGITVGGFGDISGPFAVNPNAAGSIANSPYRLTGFTPEAPGAMAGLGGVSARNVFISNGATPIAGVWDESDMASGRGRLVVLMDIDWLKESTRSSYVVNVREFLSR